MSRTRLVALLLVMGTLAIYLPVSHYGFTLYDDTDYVSENPVVQDGLTWDGIKWAFTTFHASNWHPVTWLSHELDCQLFGFDAPGMFHLVNILLHAANAVLLLILLLRLEISFWSCAFIAALFAWHPLRAESVAWIAERKDVLSGFFALLTLLAYVKYVRKNRLRDLWIALIFFALGLMSKPMLVTLPFVMLLLDFWPLQRFSTSNLRRLLVEKIPFFLLVAGSCIVTFIAQHRGGAVVALKNVPLAFRLENAVVAAVHYLLKLFWPQKLAVFYPLQTPNHVVVVFCALALIFIFAAAWRLRRSRPYLLVGWLWFVGMLVPVIGLVQVGMAALADRYSYLPSIGIFLAATPGLCDVARAIHFEKKILAAPAILVLAACLFLTHRQLNYWRDDIALFSHAVAVTKNNGTAHLNLGYAYQAVGNKAAAEKEYRAALAINSDDASAHNNLANLLDDSGHTQEAITEFQKALHLNPRFVAAYNNYGTLLVELGRYDDAVQQYTASEKIDPNDWHAPFLMGKVLLRTGRGGEAISFLQKAIRNAPNNPTILLFTAQVLASDENPKIRNGQAALALAQKADALTGGTQPAMLDALAMAYAELGDFKDATNAAQDALDLANRFGMTNDVPFIQKHLEVYRKNQPFRQSFTNAPAEKFPR